MPTLGSIHVLENATGEGYHEFMGAVNYQRFGCTDTGVRTSRFEPLSYLLGTLDVEGLLLGYNDLQGGFEELWKTGAGSAEE
jgi:hypothetical protein